MYKTTAIIIIIIITITYIDRHGEKLLYMFFRMRIIT